MVTEVTEVTAVEVTAVDVQRWRHGELTGGGGDGGGDGGGRWCEDMETNPQTVATLRREESRDHSTVTAGPGGGVSVSVSVAVAVSVSVLVVEVADGRWRCEDEDAEAQPHEKMLGTQTSRVPPLPSLPLVRATAADPPTWTHGHIRRCLE